MSIRRGMAWNLMCVNCPYSLMLKYERKGKLALWLMRPFEILERVSKVAY